MNWKKRYVIAIYILGVVLDGLSIIPMVFPSVGGAMYGRDATAFGPEYRYAMYMGAALMAGWTVLLAWGAIRPVQRRALLILTVVPVIAGLLGANAFALASGAVPSAPAVRMLVMLSVLVALFTVAWLLARQLSRE